MTEESTSVDRQREAIETWADLYKHEIVGWAIDTDVSGSLSPFDAPQLGEWLRSPDTWDGLVAWKLDRLGRTLYGLNRLFEWTQNHGKTLVCIEDRLDLSHWTGRMVASVLAGVAEGELENTGERSRASQAKLRQVGRFHGGVVPFGYQVVDRDGGRYWEVHPEEAEVIRDMARRIQRGESRADVARWLNDQGVKPRRVGRWTYDGVGRLLRSRLVLGQRTHKGRVVLGDDGMPVRFADPILSDQEWDAVQAVLDGQKIAVKRREGDQALLRDLAYCECGHKLYRFVQRTKRHGTYVYYRCAAAVRGESCGRPYIRADQLEQAAEESFWMLLGDVEASEEEYQPGTDTSEDLSRVTKALERLRQEADEGLYEDDDEAYWSRLRRLTARRKELQAVPSHGPRWVRKGLGVTWGELWRREDVQGRRSLLMQAGVTVTARDKPWMLSFDVDLEKLRQLAPDVEI